MITITKICDCCYGLGTELGTNGEELCEDCSGNGEVEVEYEIVYAPSSVMMQLCCCERIH